ncbi:MAG TPA: tetratricopeptide repeat protein [Kiloniellales bacterium]|nr:tetratricopeptide repeat protein [Kiloniellales bacterium]
MLDIGILIAPLLAGAAVFSLALLSGEDIAVGRIGTTAVLEARGYSDVVITRKLTDYMRDINSYAASEVAGLHVQHDKLEHSIGAFEQFFEIQMLMTGTRNLLGLIPIYIDGELTEDADDLVVTMRVYHEDEALPIHLARVRGNPDEVDMLLHAVATEVLTGVNPYIPALYYRRQEQAAGNWEFPETRRLAEHFLREWPLEQHYMMHALVGRMHMLRAENDPALTEEERAVEYERAEELLEGARMQQPGFLFPHINLAVIQAERGDYEEASASFRRAAELNPRYRTTRELWGEMLLRQGKTEEALAQFVAAVEIDRKDPGLRYRLAELYRTVGRPDLARQQLERAVKLRPDERRYLRAWREVAAGT